MNRYLRKVDDLTHDVYINDVCVGKIVQRGYYFHAQHEFLKVEKSSTLKGAALSLSQAITGSLLAQLPLEINDCPKCGWMHRPHIPCI